jgi:hypothetical protein
LKDFGRKITGFISYRIFRSKGKVKEASLPCPLWRKNAGNETLVFLLSYREDRIVSLLLVESNKTKELSLVILSFNGKFLINH